MGCGSSSAAAGAVRTQPIMVRASNGTAKLPPVGLAAEPQKKLPPIKAEQKPPLATEKQKENASATAVATVTVDDEKSGKGGVAFSISVSEGGGGDAEGQARVAANDIDKILRKPLPPRLRHLEPLDNAPSISPEQLAEKLRKAEEKRERMLEKRANSKVTKQSKARRNLLKAQEFSAGAGEAGDHPADPGLESLQQKQATAEQKRQAQLAAVQEKQRVREERARAARERAKRLKEEMEADEMEIEKDEGAGESDSDDASWVGDDAAKAAKLKATALANGEQQRDSSGYSSRDASSASAAGVPSNGQAGSELSSRATTGKTVSTVLEDDRDYDFYD